MERWFKNGEMISHIEGILKEWRDEPNGEIDTRNQQYDVLKVFFKKGRDVNGELKNLCQMQLCNESGWKLAVCFSVQMFVCRAYTKEICLVGGHEILLTKA